MKETIETTKVENPEIFYHGTKANLNVGDLIEAGFNSNYGKRLLMCI